MLSCTAEPPAMPSFGKRRTLAPICAFLDEAVMTSQSRLAVVIHVFMSKHQFFVFAKVSRIHTLICTCVRTCRCIFKIRVYNNSTEQLLKLPYSVSVNTTSSDLCTATISTGCHVPPTGPSSRPRQVSGSSTEVTRRRRCT